MVFARGIEPSIARRGAPHGSGLGVHRYLVERAIALPHWFRRLRVDSPSGDLFPQATEFLGDDGGEVVCGEAGEPGVECAAVGQQADVG